MIAKDYRIFLLDAYQKRYQQNYRYSQASFAKYLGVSRAYYCRLIQGRRIPSLKMAQSIAMRLELSSAEKELFIGDILKRRMN